VAVLLQDPPADGKWGAFLVDLQFDQNYGGYGWPIDSYDVYEFTTQVTLPRSPTVVSVLARHTSAHQVSIVPNTFPFEGCSGSDCYGTLV
jgi:hypothetical protein